MADYYVYLVPLPRSVEGCVRVNDDATYTIYINSNLSAARRRAALKHELEHLKRNHLYANTDAASIERSMPI